VTRSPRPEEPVMTGGAVGQQMKVSRLEAVGPKKKKGKRQRPESVKVVTVPEPAERKRKKRRDLAEYQNPSRAVQMAKKYPDQMLKEKGRPVVVRRMPQIREL
jgi:hypothetical protein